ncbi:MAG: hypothetical protein Q8R85_06110 [Bosea sp. (in: a-proteobacteria)]|uniref:hypothetical protein n=1 Tax=Bosea sp. (in: a-proteobacteria) TaxID=1871050 RepID=UPI0027339120|nr:hypothetical protein [Bosea sp. (in: a-proteobacteria)]MDP3600730.1 hypothetical protein [Bosea sp. (in: a-proteobacteria)]
MFKHDFPATYHAALLHRQKMHAPQASASVVAAGPNNGPTQPSQPQPIAIEEKRATTSDLVIRLTVEATAAHRPVDIAITIGPSAATAEMRQPENGFGPREIAR